jgi:hypothetical protein
VEAAVAEGIEPEGSESGDSDEEKILKLLRGGFETTHVLERRARADFLAEQPADAVGQPPNAVEPEANAVD